MQKEKVVFFLDYANINRGAREKRCHLDYHDLLQYVGEERFLVDAHCYVPINPRSEHRLDRDIEDLWRSGYIVTTKRGTIDGGTYKCNFDVEITMDILRVVYQVKPDIIVLASGDSDFVSLIQEVRKAGVRVEVAAFAETAGAGVLLKSSGFIDLAVYYESYLAAQNGKQTEQSVEDQYAKLIQSQNSEQAGEPDVKRVEEQFADILQAEKSDLDGADQEDEEGEEDEIDQIVDEDEKDEEEDGLQLPGKQVSKKPGVPLSDPLDPLDPLDDLDLETTID